MKPEDPGEMTTTTQKDGFLDAETCSRLHAREPEAIDAWFTQYSDALYNFAYYRVGQNREAAGYGRFHVNHPLQWSKRPPR